MPNGPTDAEAADRLLSKWRDDLKALNGELAERRNAAANSDVERQIALLKNLIRARTAARL